MSNWIDYINNKIKKVDEEEKKIDYSGEIGFVSEAQTIGKPIHMNKSLDWFIQQAQKGEGCEKGPCTYFGYRTNKDGQSLCWIPNNKEYSFDSFINKIKKTKDSDIPMYFTPIDKVRCGTNKDCIKQYEFNKLEQMKKKYSDQIAEAQKKSANLNLTKIDLEKGKTYEEDKMTEEKEKELKK